MNLTLQNLKVRTRPFKKIPGSKKDGLHQVKIRIFIGTIIFGNFKVKKKLEIKVLDDHGNDLRISSADFDNLDSNKSAKYQILTTEFKIEDAVKQIIIDKSDITSSNLFNYVYCKDSKNMQKEGNSHDNKIWNDDVKKVFDGPVSKEEWEEFQNSINIDSDEILTREDIENIAASVQFDHQRKKEINQIMSMDYLERYRTEYFNKKNIFEVFGYCWSINQKNNDPLVPDSYKSLIIQLNDYRFNQKPNENTDGFNDQWIDSFLHFLVQNGYAKVRLKNYDPFNIVKYKKKFLEAEREPYREASFRKVVKHLKRYIDILQKKGLINYRSSSKLIRASDYLGRATSNEFYTRREHSLTVDEFNLLAKTDFKEIKLNSARDMFIIAVLGGGFRTQELYSDSFTIQNKRLYIYREKTKNTSINPVFGKLNDVLARNNGKLPQFLPVEEYRKALKEIADKLNLDRIIYSPDTYINSKQKTIGHKLKDIFNPYFARKTCVTILNSMGLSEEEIIEFTAHSDQKTLKFYKGKMNIDDKEKLIRNKSNSN